MNPSRISLRLRLIILTLAISVPLLIAMMYLLTYSAGKQMTRDADQKLQLSNRTLAATTQTWLDFQVKTLEQLLLDPDIEGMDAKRQQPHLERAAQVYKHMYLVSTTDMLGRNVARSDHGPLIDYKDRPWFQAARSGVSPVFQSLIGRTTGHPALVVAMPIKNRKGVIIGSGMFAAYLTDLSRDVQATSIGKTGYAYVVDIQNRVIAHPITKYTDALQDFSSEPAIVALRQGRRGIFEFADQQGVTWRSYVDVLDSGWGVIVQQKREDILAPLIAFQRIAVVILLLGSVLLFALSWYIIRRSLKPIVVLTDTATAIASGDLSRTAPVTRQDEIGLLSQAFNAMTERLRAVITSLKERIAEKERAQVALRDSERRLSDIISLLPDATFAVDMKGRITIWNRAAEEFTGIKAEHMIGKGDYEYAIPFYGERRPVLIDLVSTPAEEIEKRYPSVTREAGMLFGEAYTRSAKQGEAYLSAVAAQLYDSEGNVIGAIESIRDITNRKKAEEELRKAHDELEMRVRERTAELADANQQMLIEIAERKRMEEKLRELSEKDPLTAIYNRRKLYEFMDIEVKKAKRYLRPLSLIMLDLDHFKRINDNYGHDAGDEVLKTTSKIVSGVIRDVDVFARYGGEEFFVLCPETDLDGAVTLAERLRASLEQHAYPEAGRVTASVGVTEFSGSDNEISFMKRADEALYAAKSKGRNRVEIVRAHM